MQKKAIGNRVEVDCDGVGDEHIEVRPQVHRDANAVVRRQLVHMAEIQLWDQIGITYYSIC